MKTAAFIKCACFLSIAVALGSSQEADTSALAKPAESLPSEGTTASQHSTNLPSEAATIPVSTTSLPPKVSKGEITAPPSHSTPASQPIPDSSPASKPAKETPATERKSTTAEDVIVGKDPCTWGPDYWCHNSTTRKQCHISKHYCDKRPIDEAVPQSQPPEECLLGPAYWCLNLTTAYECKTLVFCQEKIWHGPNPPVHCNIGPDYWCANYSTAKECNKEDYCQVNRWRSCADGEGYWCHSLYTAYECGKFLYCTEHVWWKLNAYRPIPKHEVKKLIDQSHNKHSPEEIAKLTPKGLPRSQDDNCALGPSYWCQDLLTAVECGLAALEYCVEYVWNDSKPDFLTGNPVLSLLGKLPHHHHHHDLDDTPKFFRPSRPLASRAPLLLAPARRVSSDRFHRTLPIVDESD